MEGYCRTSGCLRNYILEYFGEKKGEPCENCGNCDSDFDKTDMTSEAKTVINCVYETKGRYGLNIVLGTLLGANRARIKELGTNSYRTYGALKEHSEAELRLLINQMIMDGYLYQTADKYSVVKMGNIEPLKDENTRVIVRACKEKEVEKNLKKSQKRSKDSLTKMGYELFENLRQLRLNIAREEALPPYIIFSDKTLVDMSSKAPRNKSEMLNVMGVGEAKYSKYGDKFIEAICRYFNDNPNAITSIKDEDEAKEEVYSSRVDYNRKMNRPNGAGAAWTEAEDVQLDAEYKSGMRISEIAKIHDRTSGGILARLKRHGLVD